MAAGGDGNGWRHRIATVESTLDIDPDRLRLRRLSTSELTRAETQSIRALMDAAFGADEDERFTDDDWQHALGGIHFVLELDGEIVAHAAVVEREIHLGGHALRTGYVEAVATSPERQGNGLGSIVMTDVTDHIRESFALGGLGTGRQSFYRRLGWQVWAGPSSVRTTDGEKATPDEDGSIMVLATPSSPPFDPTAPISCAWRPGDAW
jgi:aminoglycoside 2'-N-acetyltransferase I